MIKLAKSSEGSELLLSKFGKQFILRTFTWSSKKINGVKVSHNLHREFELCKA
jgi:hypothetical protein